MAQPWQTYIDAVLSGERLAGRLERLAVERFVRLCENPRYEFDEELANYYLEILSHFRHTKGKYYGKRWNLVPWQAFFFAHIFGLVHKDTRLRVTRTVLLITAKKSGKSEIGGALGVLMTFFDGENTAECYSAANTYDQAKYCWVAGMKIAKQLAEENEYVGENIYIGQAQNNRTVKNLDTDSLFNPLPATPEKLDGVGPHCSILDEVHATPTLALAENLESGSIFRDQPLLAYVTTRGFYRAGALDELEDSFIPILEGKWEDDSVFPLIFSMDEGDNWEDEANWPKSNPNIGVTITLENLRQLYQTAKTKGGTAIVNFMTKNLNMRTNVASVWIQDDIWRKGSTVYSNNDLAGKKCYAGLDLASTRDIAAFSMFFPPTEDQPARHITRYYCPEEGIRQRSKKDKVPYENWVQEGWLTATPGNVIDYSFIEADVYAMAELFDLQLIYYDRFNGSKLIPQLVDSGVNCQPFAQTTTYFNAPLKELERLIFADEFDPGVDPLLRWMLGNVVIYKDGNGNIKFDKAKCRDKIDGMVALGMGVAGWLDFREDTDVLPDDWAPVVIKRR